MTPTTNASVAKVQEYIQHALRDHISLTEINAFFYDRWKIHSFFTDKTDLPPFLASISFLEENSKKSSPKSKDMGDYQTPLALARNVCLLIRQKNPEYSPRALIEPTCGQGNFVVAALETFPTLQIVVALDYQKSYEWRFKWNIILSHAHFICSPRIEFLHADVFSYDLSTHLRQLSQDEDIPVFLLGNPPWVTNAAISALDSQNIPKKKTNLKGWKGMEALTGKSNFDLAESIITSQIRTFGEQGFQGKFAFLCKTIVMKNMLKEALHQPLPIQSPRAWIIDSKQWFGAAVNAGMFTGDFSTKNSCARQCAVFPFASAFEPLSPTRTFGWVGEKFVADIQQYLQTSHLDGKCPFVWRQGLKHDAAKIMELNRIPGVADQYQNRSGDAIPLESQFLFPLAKSSDLQRESLPTPRLWVIVPQTRLGEETSHIQADSPLLWSYLMSDQSRTKLAARKSRIYNNQPEFAIFGIGPYSFLPYKIGISGFYKNLRFLFLSTYENKPYMLDDTCYYLSFASRERALITWGLLTRSEVRAFLSAVVFLDAKRPYTKDLLMRIDLAVVAQAVSYHQWVDHYQQISLIPGEMPSEASYESYRQSLLSRPVEDG
ncbi:MAG: hypothetical protein ACTSWW_09930 [Promethearchaeota archaeon]